MLLLEYVELCKIQQDHYQLYQHGVEPGNYKILQYNCIQIEERLILFLSEDKIDQKIPYSLICIVTIFNLISIFFYFNFFFVFLSYHFHIIWKSKSKRRGSKIKLSNRNNIQLWCFQGKTVAAAFSAKNGARSIKLFHNSPRKAIHQLALKSSAISKQYIQEFFGKFVHSFWKVTCILNV